MATYTVIGGVNGTGKSSLTGVLSAERNDLGYIIDVDKIAAQNNGNNLLAGRIAISRIKYFLQYKITFSQETTLSGHMIKKTIQEAKKSGYVIHLFYVGLSSAEESIRRIQNRVQKGGHNISSTVVISRYNKRFEILADILPFCDEVKFYDNENQFYNVAEFHNGDLIFRSTYKPKWIIELQQYLMKNNMFYNK